MNYNELLSIPFIWDVLKYETRPILLYGTGNGADKILDVMESHSIPCAGVFASDGFVRERDFRSMRVTSYSEARKNFGDDIVILCAFGSPREEILSFLDGLADRHTLYIPDVPLFCNDLFNEILTPVYLKTHRDEIEKCAAIFDETESRELFYELLAYRLSGNPAYLNRTEPFNLSVRNCVPKNVRRVIDGGAFNGDTARIFISELQAEEVICIEPDPRTFRKLSIFAEKNPQCTAVNAALGDHTGNVSFMSSSSRASSAGQQNRRAKLTEIPMTTIDAEAEKMKRSIKENAGNENFESECQRILIKLDVEGAESEAITGSAQTITEEKPVLAIALYHRTEDIFKLPLMINEIRNDYKYRLRRVRCVPGWEITLFAE